MTTSLHIKDEHGEGTFYPGQCFSIIFWAAEFIRAFGRYTAEETIEIYVWNDTEFELSVKTIPEFLEVSGFGYCDLVICEIFPLTMTLEDVKTHVKE